MTGSFMGRGNQYTQLVKVLYHKLPTIGKQLPTFPLDNKSLCNKDSTVFTTNKVEMQ